MKDIKPCPYCGGEVEVVRLTDDKATKTRRYRISCMSCKRTVGRGVKFENESDADGKERIKMYEAVLNKKLGYIKDI